MYHINYEMPRRHNARRYGRGLSLAALALCGVLFGGNPLPAWAAAADAAMPGTTVPDTAERTPAAQPPQAPAKQEIPAVHEDLRFAQPQQVELFPSGAQITVSERLTASSREGQAQADALEGRIAALNARMELHKQLPGGADSAAVESLDALAERTVPGLMAERQKLTREMEQLRKLVNAIPALSEQGKLLEIRLAAMPEAPVQVRCSYMLHDCGWQPRYSVNARPGTGKVDIALSAEVWQYSGQDWDKARLALVTRAPGALGPDALPDWIIEPSSPEAARVAALPRHAKAVPLMAAADNSGISAAEEGAFVRWEIPTTGLAQGKSILNVTSEEWAAPMQWLARPSAGESRVWMTAEYAFADRPSWPAGLMECRIDGQYVGTGSFRPEAGKVKLFFGADPRVTVKTINETRKENESGIINARRFWRWSWRYAIRNERPEEVQVRLERPLPRSVDERVTLKLEGTPAPTTDQDEGILFWEVKVPARGSSDVRQEVEITAPADLKLAPVAP